MPIFVDFRQKKAKIIGSKIKGNVVFRKVVLHNKIHNFRTLWYWKILYRPIVRQLNHSPIQILPFFISKKLECSNFKKFRLFSVIFFHLLVSNNRSKHPKQILMRKLIFLYIFLHIEAKICFLVYCVEMKKIQKKKIIEKQDFFGKLSWNAFSIKVLAFFSLYLLWEHGILELALKVTKIVELTIVNIPDKLWPKLLRIDKQTFSELMLIM